MIFKYYENAYRKEKYKKSEEIERFLDLMNQTLQSIEPKVDLAKERPLPLIFILGLMRSGTTLLTQILSHSLDEIKYWNDLEHP